MAFCLDLALPLFLPGDLTSPSSCLILRGTDDVVEVEEVWSRTGVLGFGQQALRKCPQALMGRLLVQMKLHPASQFERSLGIKLPKLLQWHIKGLEEQNAIRQCCLYLLSSSPSPVAAATSLMSLPLEIVVSWLKRSCFSPAKAQC